MNSALAAPVEGTWLVLRPPGHGRHAFDLVAVDEGSGRLATRRLPALLAGLASAPDLHGWGRPVAAPLDGEVVAAHDGEPDRRRLFPLLDVPANMLVKPMLSRGGIEVMAGNHVVLSTAAGHVLLAHLEQGSVTVAAGDRIAEGERLGLVGNSGSSVAPHLHIQVMDGPDPLTASVADFRMRHYRRTTESGTETVRDAPLPARATRIALP